MRTWESRHFPAARDLRRRRLRQVSRLRLREEVGRHGDGRAFRGGRGRGNEKGEDAPWDARKCAHGNWQVQLMFTAGGSPHMAEWVFDPRRRHVTPADDDAARLSLPEADLPAAPRGPVAATRATVTPIAPRLAPLASQAAVPGPLTQPEPEPEQRHATAQARPASSEAVVEEEEEEEAEPPPAAARERPARKAAGGRSRRSSVPSWDEIMFGNSRQPD